MRLQSRLILSLLIPAAQAAAQQPDTAVHRLAPTVVTAPRSHGGVTRLSDDTVGHIYTGVPTTLIKVDSVSTNVANSSWRQLLGRVPGANISETRGAGFPSDGIGFRGLTPRQSVEVSVRQNGVNLAGDLYGYPEQYYTPPFEAVDHIEVVRGASGLEYGPQFGGMVNFVLKDGTLNTPPQLSVKQTFESFGEYDGFGSVGGGTGHLTYYGFARYQGAAGWRQNSNFREGDAYGSLTYHFNDNVSTSLQGTLYWSRIHMPGGFGDSAFAANPQTSLRARNWIATPWSILEDVTTWHIAPGVTWTNQLSTMIAQRYLVWRNEAGGPQAIDSVDPATGQYTTPREVEREYFTNAVLESRLGARHRLLGLDANLAAGLRLFDGWMHRLEAAPGTLGADFSMRILGAYPTDMRFGTKNAAGYLQERLALTDRLTITPGARVEWLQSSIKGMTDSTPIAYDTRSQTFVLGSLGAEYAATPAVTLFGNITQAYRPITYDNLIPFGASTTSIVDPHLHHASGYTSDLGVRGHAGPLTGDVNAFYLWYGDRIGTVAHDSVIETTNVANSQHYGIESYLDLAIVQSVRWHVSLFDSFAWVDAHYTNGPFRGKLVEYAPPITNRVGPTVGYGSFSTTVTWGHTAKQYGDASNIVSDPGNPAAGVIPAFDVFDWSGRVEVGHRYQLQFGIDNFTNKRYFTFRTGEYPGPGIIPASARIAYMGVSALF